MTPLFERKIGIGALLVKNKNTILKHQLLNE
jgi:hypothetical protein